MKVYRHYADINLQGSAVALGMFDGIHLGHQVVLESAIREAKILNLPSVVVSFSTHPQVLLSKTPSAQLTSLEERLELFQALGFDIALILDFTPELMNLSAPDFITSILLNRLNVHSVSVGYDHRFGQHRQGDGIMLEEYGKTHQFKTNIIHPVRLNDDETTTHDIISSTLIRKLLAFGDIEQANTLLGRPYQITGTVVKGFQRGRTIGFPTANIQTEGNRLIPPVGTYGGFAKINDSTTWYPAVCNIGTSPTFKDKMPQHRIEIHCLNYQEAGDLYGKNFTFAFTNHLRAEQRFDSVEALIRQITQDCNTFEKTLETHQNHWPLFF